MVSQPQPGLSTKAPSQQSQPTQSIQPTPSSPIVKPIQLPAPKILTRPIPFPGQQTPQNSNPQNNNIGNQPTQFQARAIPPSINHSLNNSPNKFPDLPLAPRPSFQSNPLPRRELFPPGIAAVPKKSNLTILIVILMILLTTVGFGIVFKERLISFFDDVLSKL
jgi:hypothetical protein